MPTDKKIFTILNLCISLSATLFVAVLIVSAWVDSSIRVLHVFEAIPYIVAPWLCRRKLKTGYMLAFAGGAFWIWTAGFLTSFIRNGFERVIMLIKTGTVDRADILLAVPGFIGTLGLVVFSLVGYWQLGDMKWKDFFLQLVITAMLFLFFILIFTAFAPQYLGMFEHIIGG